MTDQPIKVGDLKKHLGIEYCWFGDEALDCPVCGTELYRQVPHSDELPERGSCPHVIYYWEKTRFGGHFFFVRPDFGKTFIQALLKSDYYEEFLQDPHRHQTQSHRRPLHHPRALKDNEISLFASGEFSSDDPMFADSKASAYNRQFMEKIRSSSTISSDGSLLVNSKVHFDEARFLEMKRYEEVGARVGNISFASPSIRHPEYLPHDIVVYYNYEGVGSYEKGDSRDRFIAISPTEYHNRGFRGLS